VRALLIVVCLSGPMLGIGLIGCTVGPDFYPPAHNCLVAERTRRRKHFPRKRHSKNV